MHHMRIDCVVLHNSCNTDPCDLPDMYALTLRPAAAGSCIHIRQITRAHVTTITCIMSCFRVVVVRLYLITILKSADSDALHDYIVFSYVSH